MLKLFTLITMHTFRAQFYQNSYFKLRNAKLAQINLT